MLHLLSISNSYINPDGITVRGGITGVESETSLGKAPLYPYPKSFEGKLLGVPYEGGHREFTAKQLDDFRYGTVDFLGKQYEFKRLNDDGTFELRLSKLSSNSPLS
jgi:hypothetical protein